MVYYLRDRHNRTIIEVEFWVDNNDDWGGDFHEISSSINLIPYTNFIVENSDKAVEISIILDAISESRGWLWETYYMTKKNEGLDEDYNSIHERMDNIFKTVAEKYNLIYVTD